MTKDTKKTKEISLNEAQEIQSSVNEEKPKNIIEVSPGVEPRKEVVLNKVEIPTYNGEDSEEPIVIEFVEPKPEPKNIGTGCKRYIDDKDYPLTLSERIKLTKKGQSVISVPEVLTGKKLNEILDYLKIDSSYFSVSI